MYRPNELASVEVNVNMGKYCTSDDDGGIQEMFDQREKASMELGAVVYCIKLHGQLQLHRATDKCGATDQHAVSRGQTLRLSSESQLSMRTGERCGVQVDMQTLSDTSSGSIPAYCNMIMYSIHLLSFKHGCLMGLIY